MSMTLEQVQEAITQLEAEGKTVSANQIVALIGGSKRDALAYLQELRALAGVGTGLEEPSEAPPEGDSQEESPAPPAPVRMRESMADITRRLLAEPIVPDWSAAQAVRKALYAQWLTLSQAAGQLHTLQKAVDAATLAVVLAENRRRLGLLLPVDPRLDDARKAALALKEPYEHAWETWSQASRTLAAMRPRLAEARLLAITAAQDDWLHRQYPAIVEEIYTLRRRIALGNGSTGVDILLQETRGKLYAHRPEAPTWAHDGPLDDLPLTL